MYCEGERTEPDYVEAVKSEPSIHDIASIEISEDPLGRGAVPLTLVQWAVEEKQRAAADERVVDEFWCLFDVEWPTNHPNLPEAMQLANEHGIKVAISNPCFELWLSLHFTHHTDRLDSDEAVDLRQDHDGSSDKSVDGRQYMSKRHVAVKHARYLEGMHNRNGKRFPCDNPSSGMHKFLDAIDGTA